MHPASEKYFLRLSIFEFPCNILEKTRHPFRDDVFSARLGIILSAENASFVRHEKGNTWDSKILHGVRPRSWLPLRRDGLLICAARCSSASCAVVLQGNTCHNTLGERNKAASSTELADERFCAFVRIDHRACDLTKWRLAIRGTSIHVVLRNRGNRALRLHKQEQAGRVCCYNCALNRSSFRNVAS